MHTHMNDSTLLFNLIFDTMMQNVSVKSMTQKNSREPPLTSVMEYEKVLAIESSQLQSHS